METFELLDWKIEFDRTETRDIYNNIEICGPEICGCVYCQNFVSLRKNIYPPEFLSLLKKLGINYEKESEVYHIHKIDETNHLYGGWFHFVGSIVNGVETNIHDKTEKVSLESKEIAKDFEISFTNKLELVNNEFKDSPVVQLEFITSVQWDLNKQS